jgi:thymidylate synthase (FAD)
MKVELLDFMGDDLAVVNAARVSFDKESAWVWEDDWEHDSKLCEKDEKLIGYLAKHNHWTPFAHTSVKFRVTTTFPIAKQLHKHAVGGVVNEVSRRYVSYLPTLDIPTEWRKSAENVKQGSSNELVLMDSAMRSRIEGVMEDCLMLYGDLLLMGVCPEQARMVLPLCSETTWIWTGSLVFFARVCKLRFHSTAQKEATDIAKEIDKYMAELFPVSWKALMA